MYNWSDIVLLLKYVVAIMVMVVLIMTPAYLAAQTKKDKANAMKIRLGSWVYLWSIIGWILALIWASRK